MASSSVTIQVKVIEQYSPAFQFIMMYKVVLTRLDKSQTCDHANESN